MKAIFSRLINSGTFPILLIRVLNTLTVTFIFIWLSRALSIEDYGHYITFWITQALIISIGALGLAAVLYNFSIRAWIEFYRSLKSQTVLRYVIYTILLSVVGCIYLYFERTIVNTTGLIALCGVLLLSIYNFILENILIVSGKQFPQLLINFIYAILLILLHWLYIDHLSLSLFLCHNAVLLLIKVSIQWGLFHAYQTKTIKAPSFNDWPVISPTKKTWIQMSINEVFQFLMRYMDKFIINLLATKEMAALYFNGRQDIPFLSAIYTSFSHGFLLELSKKLNAKNDAIIQSMKKILVKLGVVILSISVFAWIYSYEIFYVVFTEKYITSIPIFKIGLLLLPAQYLICLTVILQYKDHAEIINKGAYADAIMIIVLSIILYPIFGPIGIISSIVISTYIQNAYYLINISRIFDRSAFQLVPWLTYLLLLLINIAIAWSSYAICKNVFSPHITLLIGVISGAISLGGTFLITLRIPKRFSSE